MSRARILRGAPASRIEQLLDRAAAATGETREAIIGGRRTAPIARARFATAWGLRHGARASLRQIGAALGGRDTSTIVYQLGRADQLRGSDVKFRNMTDGLVAEARRG